MVDILAVKLAAMKADSKAPNLVGRKDLILVADWVVKTVVAMVYQMDAMSVAYPVVW